MIKYALKQHFLLIESEGVRNSFLEVTRGTQEIFDIMAKTNPKAVVLDYRLTFFNLNKSDALNLVRYYEIKLNRRYHDVRFAAVVNEKTIEIAKLWADLSHVKKFKIQIFTDIIEAEKWILQS